MKMTRLAQVSLLTIYLVSLTGCEVAKKASIVRNEDGAILKNARDIKGVESGAVVVKTTPHTVDAKIEKGAITGTVESGAITITGPLIKVESGAFTINILPNKPPALDPSSTVAALKANLKPIGSIDSLPKAQQDLIISNAAIMQSAIDSLLNMISYYNANYTDSKAPPSTSKP